MAKRSEALDQRRTDNTMDKNKTNINIDPENTTQKTQY